MAGAERKLADRSGWHSSSWGLDWFLWQTPSESCSKCSMPRFPSHKIRIALFSFCQGFVRVKSIAKMSSTKELQGPRISCIGRLLLHLSEPQMYLFELFNSCDKYSATVLIWLHLRISKHCKNFNDLSDTVPALIKIDSNTPFYVSSNTVMPQALLRRKVYISCFFQ